uniref:Uncharacterized protein n=1 Tax=Arundo donax TaxID=35708 RepID=A0A0A9E6D0_ARUDO
MTRGPLQATSGAWSQATPCPAARSAGRMTSSPTCSATRTRTHARSCEHQSAKMSQKEG